MITKKNIKVLSFGEVLFDVIQGQEHIGGAPLNFAAHIARLGAKSYILSSCGNDHRGVKAKEQIVMFDVCTDFLRSVPEHQTGVVNVELSDAGQPDYDIVSDVAYDYINYSQRQMESILAINADAFYFGTLIQRAGVSRNTLYQLLERFAGGVIFYDVNIRQNYYSKELIERSLKYASIVKLNDSEQVLISEMLFERTLTIDDFYSKFCDVFGEKILIVTKGGDGSSLFWPKGRENLPPIKTHVIDTVGAGDAFSAAFVYFYLSGQTPLQSASLAGRLGAFVVSKRGAIPPYNPNDVFGSSAY